MNTSCRIKQTFVALTVITCTACAGQGKKSSDTVSVNTVSDPADRPCSVNQAYFDGLQALQASNQCSASERTTYLEAWGKGLVDAQANNDRYIQRARDIQLQALADIQTGADSEIRKKAERLFRNMNTRIETLNNQNEKLTALQLTLAVPSPMTEDEHTTTAAKQ